MVNKEDSIAAKSETGHIETTENDAINIYDLWMILAKRKMTIIAMLLASLLCAAIYCFTASPIYRLETHAKLYMPKDIITIKELPTAKDIASMIGKIDREKKVIIFSTTANEINEAKIEEVRGATDKLKITIESRERDHLSASMQELIDYAENIREIRNDHEKIISEMDEKIKNVNEAIKKNDLQIKEIEKRLNTSKVLPVGFNPVEINNIGISLKMEKHRLEQERQNYKVIQLLQDPFIAKDPVKPKKTLIVIVAGLCGLMMGIFIASMAEYLERMKEKIRHS